MKANGKKFKTSASNKITSVYFMYISQFKFNGLAQTSSAFKTEYMKFIYLNCGIDILLKERPSQFNSQLK